MLVCCFTFGALTGAASATYQTSGDQTYYVGEPFGTLYCAVYNWSIHTNTTGGNSIGMNFILDAKSKRDVFCSNPALEPAGYNFADLEIHAVRNGIDRTCSVQSGSNPATDWVGRASEFTSSPVLAYQSGTAICSNGSTFYMRVKTRIAMNYAWQHYPDAYSWANTPPVYAQP